jgi:hypothetical protein
VLQRTQSLPCVRSVTNSGTLSYRGSDLHYKALSGHGPDRRNVGGAVLRALGTTAGKVGTGGVASTHWPRRRLELAVRAGGESHMGYYFSMNYLA